MVPLIVVSLIVTTLLLFVVLYIRWKRNVASFPNIQFAPYVPILGTIPFTKLTPRGTYKQLTDFASKYNYLYVAWVSFYPFLHCGRADYVQFVLSSQKHIKKSFIYYFMTTWLGTGLLMSDGEKWRRRRKMLTPAFHFNMLYEFEAVIIKHASVLVAKLNQLADNGESFDIQEPMGCAMLDVICETSMGVCKNAQTDPKAKEYINAIDKVTAGTMARSRLPLLWPEFIFKRVKVGREYFHSLNILHSYTIQVINDRIAQRKVLKQSKDYRPKAFLDILLESYDENKIDVDGIREEVDTFMFEGHDTTSSAVSWTLYRIGLHPEVQKKLQFEIDHISDDKIEDKSKLVEKIKNNGYLDCVIKESMRIHPPVPEILRSFEQAPIINNQKIPAGTQCSVNIHALHVNPEYWENPLEFIPERFSKDNPTKRHPFCYVPFSAGPRNCIGQKFALLEIKIMVFFILKNFNIEFTGEDVKPVFCAIQRSENGIFMTFKKR